MVQVTAFNYTVHTALKLTVPSQWMHTYIACTLVMWHWHVINFGLNYCHIKFYNSPDAAMSIDILSAILPEVILPLEWAHYSLQLSAKPIATLSHHYIVYSPVSSLSWASVSVIHIYIPKLSISVDRLLSSPPLLWCCSLYFATNCY